MIEIKKLSKRFGKLQVLNELDLQFNKGECIALIGPNGCGKTTLIKSILGMVVPNSGDIVFDGKSIKNDYEYRSQIGYMPQIGRYPENMNIGQVLTMIQNIRKHQGAIDEDLLQRFDLSSMYHKKMSTLSGGTRQKVSACLAFLFDPKVYILDEPTAGLDPLASEILKEKISAEKAKGKLVIITSHQLNDLDDLITQIVFMQEGSVLFHYNIEQLKQETGEERISKAIANILRSKIV